MSVNLGYPSTTIQAPHLVWEPGRTSEEHFRVSLVDLSGETNLWYTPLATMYLKAAVDSDPELFPRVTVRLHNFLQSHTPAQIVADVTAAQPHMIGISCQGWNFRQLAVTFSAIKQFLPESLLVLGGNHVSYQAQRILPAHPAVDLVVNGEGEHTFRELVAACLNGRTLGSVAGLSLRHAEGVVTTAERPRTRAMSELPSPYKLLGLRPGEFDIALVETNRGCPYACAFCYWGARIGDKVCKGELDRIRAELEVIGRAGVETIFLCDANFGILPQDVAVAEIVAEIRARYGTPREFNVNWAKNNANRVGDIIRVLREGDVRTTINIALQTLSTRALSTAGRSERGRQEMMDLAMELVRRDRIELYCELIYGLPGESLAEFKKNYDILYRQFPVLRIHPLWVLPNTEYDRKRTELGIRTLSPDPTSDYEALLAHATLSMSEMQDGLAMLLAHSILSLLGTARHTLRLLARYDEDCSIAALVCALEAFLARRRDPLSTGFSELFTRIRDACYFERGLRDRKRQLLYASRTATYDLMRDFFDDRGVSKQIREIAFHLLCYECLLLPRSELMEDGHVVSVHTFPFDPAELISRLMLPGNGWREWLSAAARPTQVSISHRGGLAKLGGRNCDLTGLWNGRLIETAKVSA